MFTFGSTKTYSRVVKFALSRCSLVIFVLHKANHHTFTSNCMGSAKTKQASHILQYITHLHQHTWSIHNSYMSKNVHTLYKISQIFLRVFEFALAELNEPGN